MRQTHNYVFCTMNYALYWLFKLAIIAFSGFAP